MMTWFLLSGLFLIYAGERIAQQIPIVRLVLSGGGALLVLAALVMRLRAWRAASGDARRVEQLFLLTALGCTLSVIGFFLAGSGAGWLGIEFNQPESAARFRTAASVLAAILLSISLLPALAGQWAAGVRPRAQGRRATSAVDRLRITQLAAAGLTVGLAGAFLMLAGWVASERDKTLDLSYFRTASPGAAARQIVETRNAPLRVLLFFPPANEVKDQVLGYFRALDAVAQNVTVEEHDRLASPELAAQYRVNQDGSIVLAYSDRSEIITLPIQWREARQRLRALDSEVQRALMRVAREERTIYLTTGHGELNDPSTTGPVEAAPFRSVEALQRLFGLLNYRVADLGLQNGLGNEVPGDAAMVLVLGPARPFLEPELQALDRYLAQGGSVLLALEPEGEFQLGVLRPRLGINYHAVRLADDRQHVRLRGNLADRRLIITDRFSSHGSLATLGRMGVGSGMLLMGAGYLEPDSAALPAVVVRSLPTTFADRDGDFEFDNGSEERKQYSLIAALELPRPAAAANDTTATAGRAMVFADAELFSDAVVTSLGLNAALAADAVRWLGREENLAGETQSEEDVPVTHTRAENVAWFHTTLFGAPALVLILGLLAVRRRRRTAGSEEEWKGGSDRDAGSEAELVTHGFAGEPENVQGGAHR
jgi:hypothetical protein